MGKTHEALKRAEAKYKERQIKASQELFSEEFRSTQDGSSVRKNMGCYGDLKNKLLVRNTGGSIKSVLFIETFKGGEFADHASKFAASLAEDFRLKVLLIDLNLWALDLQDVFKIDHALGLSDLFSYSSKLVSPIKKVGPGNLYKVRWGEDHSRLADQFESGEFDKFFKHMSKMFDYLILKAPGSVRFRECRILCAKVDAVALILKSGKIATQIALNAKKHIEDPADKLIGFVINKTRIYKRKLFKVSSVIVAVSFIFAFGFLLGNSELKLGKTTSLPKYIGVIPKIQSDNLIRPETFANLAQLKPHAKSEVAGEEIHEFSKTVPAAKQLQKEKPPMTSEIAPPTKAAFKTGQARVNPHKIKNESDSNKVDQPTSDVKKTAGLPVEKEIEKPMLSRGNGLDGKRKAGAGQGKVVVVERGETLFRIIFRNYGTYNDKIASRVLLENPKILNSRHIVAGQMIKLPEIH